MPPACPTVSRPRRRSAAGAALAASEPAVRLLRARAVLRGAVRLLRLQHLHRRPSSATARRARGRRTPTPRSREVRLARRVLGDARPPGRRRCSSAAAPRRCCPPADLVRDAATPSRASSGSPPDAEVTTEANPDSVTPRDWRALRDGRVHPDLLRDAVGGAARAARCSTAPTTPSGCRRSSRWARAAGFEQVSLDLIYGTPGESPGGLARLAGRRAGLRARPRLGVRPDRRGRHRAGPPGAARASCRCPTTTTWPTSTCWPTSCSPRPGWGGTRCPTGPATRRRAAGTTCSTGPAATGGASGPARTPTSAGCGGGTSSTPRAYAARLGRRASARPTRREVLDAETRRVERVLLEIRLRDGLPVGVLDAAGTAALPDLVGRRAGRAAPAADRVVLTAPRPAARRRRRARPAARGLRPRRESADAVAPCLDRGRRASRSRRPARHRG